MKRFILAMITLLASGICLAGAWGPGSFENDDALDWIQQCTESKGVAVVVSTLQAALKAGAIDAPEGAMAVAAAEVVAASKGKPSKALPEALSGWLKRQPREEIAKLAPIARKALMRVNDANVSELRQLWNETTDKEWTSTINELEVRLQ